MLENEIFHLFSVKLTGSGWQKSHVTFWLFGVIGHADDVFGGYFCVAGIFDA